MLRRLFTAVSLVLGIESAAGWLSGHQTVHRYVPERIIGPFIHGEAIPYHPSLQSAYTGRRAT